MHYYQFNIADYQSHTRHLTVTEDCCYRRMLDWIYLHEKPLPKDPKEVARILILNECSTDVERMLNEFFTCVEQGWVNVRAMSEIELFNEKLEKASKAGKASAEARKNKIKQSVKDNKQTFNERSTPVQPNNKQETLNNNQLIVGEKPAQASLLDISFEEFWNFYPKKTGIDKALTAWKKKKPKVDLVIKALEWQKESKQWQEGYIPNPATYINEGRWKDQPPEERTPF